GTGARSIHPELRTIRRLAMHGERGRVEDGRGSLGPMASAPFPIPAHRTGRTDFRYPALRLVSSQGTRWDTSRQAFQAQQSAFSLSRCTLFLDGLAPRYHWPFHL